jgi:hypothetical protein
MNVILSDEQIRKVNKCPSSWGNGSCKECGTECDEIAKAQAKHLWAILNEPCTEHPVYGSDIAEQHGIKEAYYQHRYLCEQCMSEIEKEIGK